MSQGQARFELDLGATCIAVFMTRCRRSRAAVGRCGVVLVVELLEVAFHVGVRDLLAFLDREARWVLDSFRRQTVRLERAVSVQTTRPAQRDALHVGEKLRRGPDLEVRDHPLAAEVAGACTCCRQEPGEFSDDLDGDTML